MGGDARCDRRAIRPALNLPSAFVFRRVFPTDLSSGLAESEVFANNNARLCFNGSCLYARKFVRLRLYMRNRVVW